MNYTRSLTLLPLLVLCCLVGNARAEDEARPYNILKFGETEADYILFKPDMKPFESAFTVCAWVRKLRADGFPTWFSYAVSGVIKEIQITDMGARTRLFGEESYLASVYTTSTAYGNWFHNCMSWSAADQMRYVYIDGVLVDRKATPSGRTLGQDGILVIGNEQETGVGTGMDSYNTFAGELYKLNMYSKKLTESEITDMAKDMCSNAEESHGTARQIRWEDIVRDVERTGKVEEVFSRCSSGFFAEQLEQAVKNLGEKISELETARNDLDEATKKIIKLEKAAENQHCPLSETVKSHWDILYSTKFYGRKLTKEVMEEVSESWERIGSFVGAEITDELIDFFKRYVN